jgi:hypothetical protein
VQGNSSSVAGSPGVVATQGCAGDVALSARAGGVRSVSGMADNSDEQHACAGCGKPGPLVRASKVLQLAELRSRESMLGEDAWFHRAHVPLGWRVLDFDPAQDEAVPPEV